jgi:hypothetical protein
VLLTLPAAAPPPGPPPPFRPGIDEPGLDRVRVWFYDMCPWAFGRQTVEETFQWPVFRSCLVEKEDSGRGGWPTYVAFCPDVRRRIPDVITYRLVFVGGRVAYASAKWKGNSSQSRVEVLTSHLGRHGEKGQEVPRSLKGRATRSKSWELPAEGLFLAAYGGREGGQPYVTYEVFDMEALLGP